MQIQQKGVGFEANFKPETKTFGVKDPTNLIIILRDKLYSDKLRVFMQEYISNARDANREVGKPDHQIDITAPTKSEPIFKVRDYGPGLSPERVETVFLEFGGTTKAGSDEFIGGYGIGAKSGWAYTDSFVVRSFHQGTEYHYLCHLGETPRGSMATLFTGPTTEPDGVEVQVQVQQDDIQRAHGLLKFLTKLWPEKPNIINSGAVTCSTSKDKYLPFEIGINESHSLPEITLSLDGIPYSVTCSYLTRLTAPLTGGSPIIFRAKTGDVDVAANREQVEINAKYKKWLNSQVEQTIHGIQKMHLDATGQGLVKYVEFWHDRGRKLSLQRARSAQTENTIDYPALRILEEKTMEGAYHHIVKHHPKMVENLKELNLIVVDQVNKDAGPSFPRLDGFGWYFKEEKVLLANNRLYPVGMKKVEVFGRRKEQSTGYTDRRTRKELFQMPYELWKGYVVDDNKVENGFSLHLFETSEYDKSSAILFNDEPKDPEKLKRLTSRIASRYKLILNVQDVPQFLKDLNVEPLTKHVTPVHRNDYARVNRPTGSVRLITWADDSGGTEFSFQSYMEPKNFIEGRKFNSEVVLYANTTEPRSTWSATLKPHRGRMSINEMSFVQGNKKGIKYLQDKMPKIKFMHWDEWAEVEEISEANVTQIEYEQFTYEWLRSTNSKSVELWTEGNKIQLSKLTDALYADFVKEIRAASSRRGGRDGHNVVGDNFIKNKSKIKSLNKSRIYQMRMELLKKYPLLPLIEVEASHHNIYPLQEMFNEYMENPKTYMRNRANRHGNAENWLQSKK